LEDCHELAADNLDRTADTHDFLTQFLEFLRLPASLLDRRILSARRDPQELVDTA
jgi:hypothetical protein